MDTVWRNIEGIWQPFKETGDGLDPWPHKWAVKESGFQLPWIDPSWRSLDTLVVLAGDMRPDHDEILLAEGWVGQRTAYFLIRRCPSAWLQIAPSRLRLAKRIVAQQPSDTTDLSELLESAAKAARPAPREVDANGLRPVRGMRVWSLDRDRRCGSADATIAQSAPDDLRARLLPPPTSRLGCRYGVLQGLPEGWVSLPCRAQRPLAELARTGQHWLLVEGARRQRHLAVIAPLGQVIACYEALGGEQGLVQQESAAERSRAAVEARIDEALRVAVRHCYPSIPDEHLDRLLMISRRVPSGQQQPPVGRANWLYFATTGHRDRQFRIAARRAVKAYARHLTDYDWRLLNEEYEDLVNPVAEPRALTEDQASVSDYFPDEDNPPVGSGSPRERAREAVRDRVDSILREWEHRP